MNFKSVYSSQENAVFLGVSQAGTGKSTAVEALRSFGVRAFDLDSFGKTLFCHDMKQFYINVRVLLGVVRRGDILMGSASNMDDLIKGLEEGGFNVNIFSLLPATPKQAVDNIKKRLDWSEEDWVGKSLRSPSAYDALRILEEYGIEHHSSKFFGFFKVSALLNDAMSIYAGKQRSKHTVPAELPASFILGNGCRYSEGTVRLEAYVNLAPTLEEPPKASTFIDLSNDFPKELSSHVVVAPHGGTIGNLKLLQAAIRGGIVNSVTFPSNQLYSCTATLLVWCLQVKGLRLNLPNHSVILLSHLTAWKSNHTIWIAGQLIARQGPWYLSTRLNLNLERGSNIRVSFNNEADLCGADTCHDKLTYMEKLLIPIGRKEVSAYHEEITLYSDKRDLMRYYEVCAKLADKK